MNMRSPRRSGRARAALAALAAGCALVALAGCGTSASRADPPGPTTAAPPSTTPLTVVPPADRRPVSQSTTTTTTRVRSRVTYPSFESCKIGVGRPVTYDAVQAAWLANTVEPSAPGLERVLCAAANATSSQALIGPQTQAVASARNLYAHRVITLWERDDVVDLVRNWNADRARRPGCAITNADGTTSPC